MTSPKRRDHLPSFLLFLLDPMVTIFINGLLEMVCAYVMDGTPRDYLRLVSAVFPFQWITLLIVLAVACLPYGTTI